ncbi:MAG: CofH family radical SAM protein [Candidatus Omnitrophota bacterium]|jgi:aminodeoxyfutalosine synthase
MDESQGLLKEIRQKIISQKRLDVKDGLDLFKSTDILAIGRMAQAVRERMHGRRAFYAVNLHLNPTNVCATRCEFCAFSRDAGAPDAYTLTLDEIEQKVREALRCHSINEVHIVGGHNPLLGFDYYLKMVRRIRQTSEEIFIKAFSAPEIDFMAKRSGLSWVEVLRRLKEAGLDGMPGGGAEIFDPGVRAKICPEKISGAEWLQIHRAAHETGLRTNATMLYGHIETDEQRVAHLLKLRELQDETQGFSAFVPLAYHPENNALGGAERTSGFLDLKVLSISRLLLDNIPHIKAHGPATDLKFVQVALSFGADDAGGTNLHERVMHEAGGGAPAGLSSGGLVRCITDAGFEPYLVDSSYQIK